MFDTIKEHIRNFFESRLLPVAVLFVLLFAVLVNRMFQLQIAPTDSYASEAAKRTEQTREIKASRGNIYDCNGKLLAYNDLSYNVVFTANDITSHMTSKEKNQEIYYLLKILEREGDKLSVEFYIRLEKGKPVYTVSGNSLLRFKAEAFSTKVESLNQEQRDMTAQELFDFLGYDDSSISPKFMIDKKGQETHDDETALQIMSVRYAMYINRFKNYQSIILAQDVDDKTVAAIKENNNELPGINIEEDATRVYNKSKYFAHILGYTGSVTTERLEELREENPNTPYTTSDQIGISGIESTFEEYLCGEKGTEKLTVNDTTMRVENVEKEKC